MKEFRLNLNNLIICEECGRECKNQMSLTKHLPRHKISIEEYYIKWLKEDDEGFCKICGIPLHFKNLKIKYKKTCSKICELKYKQKICYDKYGVYNYLSAKDIRHKIKQTNIKKYGTEVPSKTNIVKQHAKENNIKKYGVENVYQVEKIKNKCKKTKLERYGNEKFRNPDKTKITNLKRYGSISPLQNKRIQEKTKITMNLKYGVDHQSQNASIHHRQMKSGKRIKIYENTNLWYQGSYELDFIKNFYNKIEIKRATSIKYSYQNKEKIYHPDFYIPVLNLIVEIKNSYYANRDKLQIEAKKQGTVNNGYNYILIINKEYSEFLKILNYDANNRTN